MVGSSKLSPRKKYPALAPYIIQWKRVLVNSASEKPLLERLRVAPVLVELPNSMIEGQINKDCRSVRPMKAPIKNDGR